MDKFKTAISHFTDKIQWLANHNKINKPSLADYYNIIKMLTESHNKMTAYIDEKESDNQVLINKYLHQKRYALKLEAICFIHGINNLKYLIEMDTDALVSEAKENLTTGRASIPVFFMTHLTIAGKPYTVFLPELVEMVDNSLKDDKYRPDRMFAKQKSTEG